MNNAAELAAKRSKLSVYCIGLAHAKARHDSADAKQWTNRIYQLKQELSEIEKQQK